MIRILIRGHTLGFIYFTSCKESNKSSIHSNLPVSSTQCQNINLTTSISFERIKELEELKQANKNKNKKNWNN